MFCVCPYHTSSRCRFHCQKHERRIERVAGAMQPNPFCFCTKNCRFRCWKRERRIELVACWIILLAMVTVGATIIHYLYPDAYQ